MAAIDCGTNAIRFLAAEPDEAGGFQIVSQTRLPVRLGHGVFTLGRIDDLAASEAVEGLSHVAREMQELAIERYRAVATSAVRESPNRRAFLRRVREESGLRLELISGTEEIRLVHEAVRRRMALGTGSWVLVELGGGSVEVGVVDADKVSWSETHAMGAVRMVELFSHGEAAGPDHFARLVEEYAATIRLPEKLRARPSEGFIATGGNIESIVRIVRSGPDTSGLARIGRAELRDLIGTLAAMTVADRQRVYGLRADRADVIVPAAIVYAHLAELVGADEIVVPGGGVREGIVFDLIDRPGTRRAVRAKGDLDDALALGRKFLFDERHGEQVALLAGQLFDQLVTVHGMGSRERRLLVTAALLHDVGGFVSIKSHHKHSLYLIARAELAGFTAREMHLIGIIARYHRKSPPSTLHPEFSQLSGGERERVRRCAAFLRVADALDKEHSQKIRGVQAMVKGRVLQIRAEGAMDVLLEQWALKKKDDLFREVFGLQVSLDGDGEAGRG